MITMNVSGTGTIQMLLLINNGIFTLVNFTMDINNATFINKDSIMPYNADNQKWPNARSGLVNNLAEATNKKAYINSLYCKQRRIGKKNTNIILPCHYHNFGTISTGNSAVHIYSKPIIYYVIIANTHTRY